MKKYKSGDFCYIVDTDNKIKLCQVKEELIGEGLIAYQVQDTIDWRFICIEHKYCADNKSDLKGIKREKKNGKFLKKKNKN